MNHCLNMFRSRALFFTGAALLALPVLSSVSRADPTPINVTYNGGTYGVSWELSDYNTYKQDHTSGLEPWLNDSNAAATFASLVGSQLGLDNFGFQGPYFVFSDNGNTWTGNFYASHQPGGISGANVGGFSGVYQYNTVANQGWLGRFAYVIPVMIPDGPQSTPDAVPEGSSTYGLMLAGLAALGIASRRFKSSVA
jgi:hypothetical protein